MACEGVANGRDDVTIFLVQKGVSEQGHVAKKKKRSGAEVECLTLPLDMIFADSGKLRKGSKYFETCMSGRWPMRTPSEFSSRMEFHLEVQTEILYYHDCFERLSFPFVRPIPSVNYCVQLLKVASQIEYHDLMDICVKFLSAVPWSVAVEKHIREFWYVGHLSSNSTSDLCARLRVPLTEKQREKEISTLTERVLSRYLEIALSKDSTFEVFDSRYESRQVFTDAFHALVASCPGSSMCHDVLQYALSIVTKELEKVLVSMMGSGCQKGWGPPTVVTVNLLQFCWLFEVLRGVDAAQVVVELILKLDVSRVLMAAFDPYATASPRQETIYQWAKMMYLIFQDVLQGRLFLKTSERVILYQKWNWILKKVDDLSPEEPPVSKVVASFIMSFPHLQQEEILLRWASSLDEYPRQADYNLSQAHTIWMTSLLGNKVPKLERKRSASQLFKDNGADKFDLLRSINNRTTCWDTL